MGHGSNIMKKPGTHRVKKSPNGYALLLVVFFVALLVLGAAAAAPNLVTQGRREKEKELVWRGNQYVRGIRLYYQKTHRLPTQLEDLYKPTTGFRFMRKAYKDPINGEDGSWRLISVGPDGRLVGSLRPQSNAFFFGAQAPTGFAGALSPNTTSSISQNSPNSSGTPAQTPNPPADPKPQSLDSPDATPTPPPNAPPPSNGPTGGNSVIVGVGSKINKRSIRWLDGGKNYLQYEFVWDGKEPVVPAP
jgi:hypothetical protein